MRGVDPKIKAKAMKRLRAGETKAQIARALGVTTKTLQNWARAEGLLAPAADGDERDATGKWRKGVTGNPTGATSELAHARALAQRNAAAALQRLMAHADRIEKWLDDGEDPSVGRSMAASELTRVLKTLAGPSLAAEKSTVEVQHSGEVAHAHRVTVEPIAVGEALDILAGLGLAPAAPTPAAVDPAPTPPQAARGPAV